MHRRLHTAAHLGRKSSRLPLLVPDLPTIARGGTVRIDGAITQVNGAFAQIHRQPAARFEFGINGWVSLDVRLITCVAGVARLRNVPECPKSGDSGYSKILKL